MRLRNIKGSEGILAASPYVIQEPDAQRGRWNEVFGNANPIYIEIGMGKGKFIMELAKANPELNYIGIERYSSVLIRALQKRQEQTEDFNNLYFICVDARELTQIFSLGEVYKVYLNFSDPWPKDRHRNRRLTSAIFMGLYDQVLTGDGFIEFKTDNRGLFDFSLESIEEANWRVKEYTLDLHNSKMSSGNVMTEYESKFVSEGKPIYKLITAR